MPQPSLFHRPTRRKVLGVLAALAAAPACRIIETPLTGLVKIGLVAPFSGRDYVIGYNVLFAVKQALKHFNEAGGYKGWRVELLAHDDQNDSSLGVEQARKLTIDAGVMAVVGHQHSGSALAAAPEYKKANIPFYALASADNLAADPATAFRLGPSNQELARSLTSFIPSKFQAVRLALVSDDQVSGKLAEELGKLWWSAGQVVYGEQLPAEITEFGPQATKILNTRPDAVTYFGGVEAGAPLYAEVRRLAPGIPFIASPAAASPHFAKLSGSPTDFAYLLEPVPDPAELPSASAFVQEYRATWGVDPLPQAALAYDGVQLALEAISRAVDSGTVSRNKVMEVARRTSGLPGITGPLRFDSAGNRIDLAPTVYRLVGQRFPGEKQSID